VRTECSANGSTTTGPGLHNHPSDSKTRWRKAQGVAALPAGPIPIRRGGSNPCVSGYQRPLHVRFSGK
jgi:hypothetical protein